MKALLWGLLAVQFFATAVGVAQIFYGDRIMGAVIVTANVIVAAMNVTTLARLGKAQ